LVRKTGKERHLEYEETKRNARPNELLRDNGAALGSILRSGIVKEARSERRSTSKFSSFFV
jgi:hypothetical protein